jgi:DNA-binding transcriptional LysR family regulator
MSHDLDGLQTFVEVIERGGFTAAAKRLGVSKSIASRRVARLEAALGSRLLNRTTRGMALTDVGQAFFERCRTVLAELEAACEDATGQGSEISGLLRISAPTVLARPLIAPVVAELMARHTRLRFDIALDERIVDLVGSGFDLAVRTGSLPDSRFIARPLARLHGQVVASPDYLRRHGTPETPAALAGHVCLEHSELGPAGQWRFEGPGGEVVATIGQQLRVNSFETLEALALAGTGLTVLPTFLGTQALADGRLQRVLTGHAVVGRELHALAPPTRRLSPKVRLLMDTLVAHAARPAEAWGG